MIRGLLAPVGCAIALSTGAAQAATLQFSPATVTVTEGAQTSASFTVTRSGDTSQAATVRFASVDGTAKSGQDYAAVPAASKLKWLANDANPKTITVPISDDALGETAEQFTVTLSAPTGDTLGTASTGTVTLKDNDISFNFSTASFKVNESGPSATITVKRVGGNTSAFASVDIFPDSGGTATNGADYSFDFTSVGFPGGTTSQTFTIPISQDAQDEPNETLKLKMQGFFSTSGTATPGATPNATLTISDDDSLFSVSTTKVTVSEDVGNVVATVRRLNGSVGAASVQFTTADGSAKAPGDYGSMSGTLLWADGDSTARTVTIPIANDAALEGKEGFYFVLSNPSGGQVKAPVAETIYVSANDGGETLAVFENSFNRSSPLGTNLGAVTDFAAEIPFSNYFKQARFWISGNTSTGAFDDHRSFFLDANDYITRLRANQVARVILFTGVPADPALTGLKLILRYDGDGDFAYPFGAMLLSHAAGRDVIQIIGGSASTEATTEITLTRTNINNPVKNIRLTPEGGICRSKPLATVAAAGNCSAGDFVSFEDAATQGEIIFNPAFLDSIKTYRTIRFINWLATINSPLANFADRPKVSDAFWSIAQVPVDQQNPQHKDFGVPLEAVVALTNLMNFDAWVHVPHLATDDYITQFSNLLAAQVATGRKLYVEYSNETWNCLFTECQFVREQGRAQNLAPDESTAGSRFTSQRAQQVFDALDTAFGAARPARVVRVMAGQSSNTGVLQEEMLFTQAAAKTDVLAIAPYFGETLNSSQQAEEVKRLGVDGMFDWLMNDNNAILTHGSLPSIDHEVANHLASFASFGIPTVSYEGGQHLLAPGFDSDTVLNGILDSVNRDPRMKGIYTAYLANWRARNAQLFNHYLHVERWGTQGRWGAKEFTGQARSAAPKFDGLQTYIESQPLP